MVCPYCGTRNGLNAPICGQCGAILRDTVTINKKSNRKTSHNISRHKITLGSLTVIVIAPVIAFMVGFFLGKIAFEGNKPYQIYCGLAATFLSFLIISIVSFGRVTLLRIVYGSNKNSLTKRVNELVSTAQEAQEALLEENNTPEGRYFLASLFLLINDTEKSMQQFEQAQQLHAPTRPEDINNLAVALAARGQIGPAYDRLERAISVSPLSPQPKFNIAKILNQTGREVDAKAAEQKLTESIKAFENNTDLINQLGLSWAVQGRFDEATRLFEKAYRSPGKTRDRETVVNSRNNIALTYAMAGRLDEAKAELNLIIKAEPENARAIANYGVILIAQRRYTDAIVRLTKAVQLDPDLALAHCNLGYAYSLSGAINEGIREYRAAVLLEPYIFEAQYNLGKAYLDEGILDVAEKSLVRALQLRRTSWQAHHAMGVLYYNRGLYDKALACFTDSLKLSPLEAVTLSAIGVCYVKRGNVDTAYKQLKFAMGHNNHNAEVLTNLSWLQISNEELHDATDTSKRAIAADQALAQPSNNLGLCQLALGAPEVALEAFKKALLLDPSLDRVHHHLGSAHVSLKQIDNAIKEWRLASQFEPGNGDVYTNLGVALYRQGRTEEAITEFKRVIKVRTDRKEDYINLGLALASAKHHKEAIEQFDKALAIDPRNAVVHSNRGLACYFGNDVEEAMREWTLVTQLDPAYAKRRGKKQESEYDDAIIEYIPLNVTDRALFIKPHTAEYLFRYLPGYETDKWLTIPPSPELEPVIKLNSQIAKINRQLNSLDVG